ncbi:hypothetical protein N0V88_002533 [Collariella sp. IMI 366227]|nr:hypothetical protein N0V88_002533 [Collariella sp. IMI 366227]
MAAPPPPPGRGGMSLYANLLNTDSGASISRDPVLFKDGEANDTPAKKAIDPALRFQPIRRPQIKQTPNTLADWAATNDDDEYLYTAANANRQRGGRRSKKKKGNNKGEAPTDWDELYDPARPTNVEEYLRSEERWE